MPSEETPDTQATDGKPMSFLLGMDDGGTLRVNFALDAESIGDGDTPSNWQTILTVGKGEGKPLMGGPNPEFTLQDLKAYVANFKGPAKVDVAHATLQAAVKKDPRFLIPELSGARAFITKLRVVGDALQAMFEWTKAGAALVRSGLMPFPSVEIGKTKQGPTVIRTTMTPDPFWKVPAFAMSDGRIEAIDIDADAGGAISEPTQYPSASANRRTKEEPMSDVIKALAEQLGVDEDNLSETITAMQADAAEKTALAEELETVKGDLATALAADATHKDAAERMADMLKAQEGRIVALESRTGKSEEDRAIAQLFADGRLQDDEEEQARKDYALSIEHDLDVFDRHWAKRDPVVPVSERGGNKPDTSKAGGDDITAMSATEASGILDDKIQAHIADNDGATYADAFAAILPDNVDLAAKARGATNMTEA